VFVAADAVDLEWNIVASACGFVCTRLVRRRKAVAAHFLEQARRGGSGRLPHVHVIVSVPRVAGRRHAGQ